MNVKARLNIDVACSSSDESLGSYTPLSLPCHAYVKQPENTYLSTPSKSISSHNGEHFAGLSPVAANTALAHLLSTSTHEKTDSAHLRNEQDYQNEQRNNLRNQSSVSTLSKLKEFKCKESHYKMSVNGHEPIGQATGRDKLKIATQRVAVRI